MSHHVSSHVWVQDLKAHEKLVLLQFAEHADHDGVAYPKFQHIAEECGMTVRSVRRLTRTLERRGVLAQLQRSKHHAAAVYRVLPLVAQFRPSRPDKLSAQKNAETGQNESARPDKTGHLYKEEPSVQPSVQIKIRSRKQTAQTEPDPPIPGIPYTGGHVHVPKTKKRDRHTDHVFCGDWIHVSAEKHAEYEQRIKLAGFDLAEVDLAAFYRRADEELAATATTEHPNFWLAKRFSEELKATAEATA